MRIFLIESGGFVGVPLRYEVDATVLGASVLSALERAMAAAPAEEQPSTSAGETRIRLEGDDGSIRELTLSHAAATRETAELVENLRAFARIVPER